MQYIKAKISVLLHSDLIRRVAHTFWQAAGGALVAGLVTVHSSADVKSAVMVAVAAGLAAVKALVVSRG